MTVLQRMRVRLNLPIYLSVCRSLPPWLPLLRRLLRDGGRDCMTGRRRIRLRATACVYQTELLQVELPLKVLYAVIQHHILGLLFSTKV